MKTNRMKCFYAIPALLGACTITGYAQNTTERLPNVIYIIADDLRNGD